jgi:diguanylate cyclase (GGDEF)-like protein/PAS domain S-box-containing protein
VERHGEASAIGRPTSSRAPSRLRRDHDAPDSHRALSARVFAARHIGISALALATVLLPAMGPQRFWIAALLLFVALPYDFALHVELHRTGQTPGIMAFSDQLMGAVFAMAEPRAWVPTLVILTVDVALAVSTFGTRRAVAALGVGCALLSVAGREHFDGGTVAVGVSAYAIGGLILVFTVGALWSGERRLQRRYHELVSGIDAVVWESEAGSLTFSYVSPGAERLLGYPQADWLEPDFWSLHLHPDDREEAIAFCMQAERAGHDHEFEYRMLDADGNEVWVHDVVRLERGNAGRPPRMQGVMFDVTDRKRAEDHIRRFANIVERMPLGMLIVRAEGDRLVLVAANPAAGELLGVTPALLLGQPLAQVLPRISSADMLERLLVVADGGDAFEVDRLAHATPDSARVVALRAFPLPGRSVGISVDDVTAPSLAADVLTQRALHDDLTALPNRTLLRDRLGQALQEAERTGDSVALLILDLDQFKEVNDALGHQYGDLLLVEVAHRLTQIVRDCDTIARLGGDEFAILLTTDASAVGAVAVAEKVTDALALPFEVEGMALQTNASIGIALYPVHAETAEALTQRADVAMYAAKRSAARYSLYAPDDDRSSVARLTLLGEIRRAVREGEFVLAYQPMLDLATDRIVSAEALVRWQHPEHGTLEPGLFIELAEVSGVIHHLTRSVITTAVEDLARWRRAGSDLLVSVNLSVRNLYDAELLPFIRATLHRAGLGPESLRVELTESQLMDDMTLAMDVLGALRAFGIETAIDDFGTGYSSLAYLRDLPISEVKIDQSFVTELARDHGDVTIVRSIIDLAHNLGLTVLAEGVEDEAVLQVLRALGCDRVQGFAVGRPMRADQLFDVVFGTPAETAAAS